MLTIREPIVALVKKKKIEMDIITLKINKASVLILTMSAHFQYKLYFL